MLESEIILSFAFLIFVHSLATISLLDLVADISETKDDFWFVFDLKYADDCHYSSCLYSTYGQRLKYSIKCCRNDLFTIINVTGAQKPDRTIK